MKGPGIAVMERDRQTAPMLPERVLHRVRLARRLAEWAPITVLRGPQGFGKTTAVADWLAEQPAAEVAVVWLTIPEPPVERQTLLALLAQQLRAAGLMPDFSAPPTSVAVIAEALPNVPGAGKLALVLDNARGLTDGSMLEELVALVRRHLELHLFVLTRASHPIEPIAARTGAVNTIPPVELALTVSEIEEFAVVLGSPVEADQAAEVHRLAGGWTAAVQLLLPASDGEARPGLIAAREYLRTSLFSAFDDDALLLSLLQFSLAAQLDFELIRALGEPADSDALIQRLEGVGLPQRDYRDDRVVLVLPSLVRDVLREAFAQRDPQAAMDFHRRLAQWYHSQPGNAVQLDALEHAVAGHDWGLAHVVWAEFGTWLSLWELDRVRFALAEIPEDVMLRYPGTHVARFVLDSMASDNDTDARSATIRTYFEASGREVNDHRDRLPLADLLFVGTGHLIGLRFAGELRAAVEFATELEPRIAELTTTGHELHDRLGWFYLQRAITQTLIGDDDSAIRFNQRAWE
ncbi:MAG: ATP-dependent transcriptional regulator, MalT-like, LuxR family, partial [Frankiales bacterium]|nr:ATP-dependent transcriptional regulator, MalT-like, LuxR family [Frankiales bacterium]